MAEQVDIGFAIGLEPERAVAYFQSKGYDYSFDWYDIWQGAHTQSFTVAKAMQMDVLDDIREWVDKAIKDGVPLQEFTKELTPRLQKRGWWGREVVTNPKGGNLVDVQLGSPTRLETIYRTNTQVAYNVGRYHDQVLNIDDRPYWQYVAVMDTLTRPTHAVLNGKVFKATDPFWHTHYPPNGFNCRCRVRALTKEQVEEKGLEVYEGEGKLSEDRVSVARGVNVPVTVFKGYGINMHPDPGWSYNPGRTTWKPELPPHIPEVVKEFKKAVDGRGLAKEIKAGDIKGLNDVMRTFDQENPGMFWRGFKEVQVVDMSFFEKPQDRFFMATDSHGKIFLLDHTLPEYDGWNPARDTLKAMDKIGRGKRLDFNQEYSIEALWHEVLHNRARGRVPLPARSFDRVVMETLNQFTARHTYPEFLSALGGLESMGPRVLVEGYGYGDWIRNFRIILKASGIQEGESVVETLQQVNTYARWDRMRFAVAEALAKEFGDVRWSRKFLQVLELLNRRNPEGLAQDVRGIILEP
jgi:SPP1 gp7 family putative phage head morphogenesis protein